MSLGQTLSVCAKELGDGDGVPLVGLGLPQRELGEVRDKQRIDQPDVEALGLKEREEVQIIGAG